MSECRFFKFIGASGCDGCGRPASEHDGIEVLKRDAGPFGDGGFENLTWAEWKVRKAENAAEREAREQLARLLGALPADKAIALAQALS